MIYNKKNIAFTYFIVITIGSAQVVAQDRTPIEDQVPTAPTVEPQTTPVSNGPPPIPLDTLPTPSRIVLAPIRVSPSAVRGYDADGRPVNTQGIGVSGLDPELRPPPRPPEPDPVLTLRGTRTAIASGATAGVAVGATLVLGFALLWTLLGPTSEPFFVTTTVGVGGLVFGLPAVYYGVSSAYGGNGSYWSTVGGGFVGFLLGGTVSAVGYFAGPGVGGIVSMILVPTSMIIGMSLAYEDSTIPRRVQRPQTPTNRHAMSGIFPSIFTTTNAQGLVLSGSF